MCDGVRTQCRFTPGCSALTWLGPRDHSVCGSTGVGRGGTRYQIPWIVLAMYGGAHVWESRYPVLDFKLI